MTETIGFIGLGSQGGPMARRIIEAGFRTLLWARRPEALQAFADSGVVIAATPEALAAHSDILCLCVVDDAGVEALCNQLIPAMRTGGLLVIHSTIHPRTCLRLQQQAATRGIALIDAPVSGGGPAAQEGTLTVMLGGANEDVARVMPVLQSYAGLVSHLGGVGAGQTAKLVNNNLMAANLALAHAAAGIGSTLGLDRTELLRLMARSSGRSFALDVYGRMPSPGAFTHGAALLAKDIRLLGELADAADPDYARLSAAGLSFIDAVTNDGSEH